MEGFHKNHVLWKAREEPFQDSRIYNFNKAARDLVNRNVPGDLQSRIQISTPFMPCHKEASTRPGQPFCVLGIANP